MKDVNLRKDGKVNFEVSVDRFANSKSSTCATASVVGNFDENEDYRASHFVNVVKCVPNQNNPWNNYQAESESGEKICFSNNVEETKNADYEKFDLLIENPNAVSKSAILIKSDGSTIIQFNDEKKSQIKILPNGKIDILNSEHNLISLVKQLAEKGKATCQAASQITVTVSLLNTPTPIDNLSSFTNLVNDYEEIKSKIESFL